MDSCRGVPRPAYTRREDRYGAGGDSSLSGTLHRDGGSGSTGVDSARGHHTYDGSAQ
jgi:hypothetical protein